MNKEQIELMEKKISDYHYLNDAIESNRSIIEQIDAAIESPEKSNVGIRLAGITINADDAFHVGRDAWMIMLTAYRDYLVSKTESLEKELSKL